MSETKTCPNCEKKLNGMMSSRSLAKQAATDFINQYNNTSVSGHCTDCGDVELIKIRESLTAQKNIIKTYIENNLEVVPVITLQQPPDWKYDIVEMVSAQSVSGTGFLTEFASGWTDLLGGQSESMANKLLNGENICKQKLRFACINAGGNAVIGTDIDYSEVGGVKGMLMVCMAGTAINVNQWPTAYKEKQYAISELMAKLKELNELKNIKIPQLEINL